MLRSLPANESPSPLPPHPQTPPSTFPASRETTARHPAQSSPQSPHPTTHSHRAPHSLAASTRNSAPSTVHPTSPNSAPARVRHSSPPTPAHHPHCLAHPQGPPHHLPTHPPRLSPHSPSIPAAPTTPTAANPPAVLPIGPQQKTPRQHRKPQPRRSPARSPGSAPHSSSTRPPPPAPRPQAIALLSTPTSPPRRKKHRPGHLNLIEGPTHPWQSNHQRIHQDRERVSSQPSRLCALWEEREHVSKKERAAAEAAALRSTSSLRR